MADLLTSDFPLVPVLALVAVLGPCIILAVNIPRLLTPDTIIRPAQSRSRTIHVARLTESRKMPARGSVIRPSIWNALPAGISLLAAVMLCVVSAGTAERHDGQALMRMYDWLALPGLRPLVVSMDFRIDSLSALLLTLVLLTQFLVTAVWSPAAIAVRQIGRFHVLAAFLVVVSLLLYLSTDFLQLYVFWQLQTVAACLLLSIRIDTQQQDLTGAERALQARQTGRTGQRDSAMRLYLISFVADAMLLLGVLLIWYYFRTFDMQRVLSSEGLANVMRMGPAIVPAITFCLFCGAAGKAAQIPFFIWLARSERSPVGVHMLLQATALFPTGIYLMVRCEPLFALAPQSALLIATIGGMTALLAGLMSAAQVDLRHVLSYSSVACYGLMFVALGTGVDLEQHTVLFLLVVHALAKSVLWRATENVVGMSGGCGDLAELGGRRRILPTSANTFLVAAAVLSSGFWGHDTLSNHLWDTLDRVASLPLAEVAASDVNVLSADLNRIPQLATMAPAFGPEASGLLQLLLVMTTATIFLHAFALFRAYFLTFHHATAGGSQPAHRVSNPQRTEHRWALWGLLALAIGLRCVHGGPLWLLDDFLDGRLLRPVSELLSSGQSPLEIGIAGPVGLLGIVIAWMMYAQPTAWPQRLVRIAGPIVRLSRHGFYLEEALQLLIALPVRISADILRFLNLNIVVPIVGGLATRFPRRLGEVLRATQNGQLQIYALTTLCGSAVLFWTLFWLRQP